MVVSPLRKRAQASMATAPVGGRFAHLGCGSKQSGQIPPRADRTGGFAPGAPESSTSDLACRRITWHSAEHGNSARI